MNRRTLSFGDTKVYSSQKASTRIPFMYLGINLFPDSIYPVLYLPMVVVIFGLLAFWFFQYKQDQLNPQNNEA